MEIQVRGGAVLIDERDRSLVEGWPWVVRRSGSKGKGRTGPASQPYVVRWVRNAEGCRRVLRLHRVVLGVVDPALIVDHVNGDTLDNRRGNLRVVSAEGSRANAGNIGGRSAFRGVSWSGERQLWRARLRYRGESVSLGYFESEVAAAAAWNVAALERWGELARLNVV